MNLKFALLPVAAVLIGTIAASPAFARPVVEEPNLETRLEPNTQNLRLNPTQQRAIEQVSEFAFDQLEAALLRGLNPEKQPPADTAKKAEELGQTLKSVRLDAQQTSEILRILRTARQQVEDQIDRNLDTKKQN